MQGLDISFGIATRLSAGRLGF